MATTVEINKWYQILDLEPGAPWEEIQKHYRELAPLYSPDKHEPGSKAYFKAEEMMKRLNNARDNLRNLVGANGSQASGSRSSNTAPPPNTPPPPSDGAARERHTASSDRMNGELFRRSPLMDLAIDLYNLTDKQVLPKDVVRLMYWSVAFPFCNMIKDELALRPYTDEPYMQVVRIPAAKLAQIIETIFSQFAWKGCKWALEQPATSQNCIELNAQLSLSKGTNSSSNSGTAAIPQIKCRIKIYPESSISLMVLEFGVDSIMAKSTCLKIIEATLANLNMAIGRVIKGLPL